MAVFFKHIFRTIKKSPVQPILILLTVIMSVAVGVTAFRFCSVFFIRSNEMANEEIALGDIVVTASSERKNGILFDSDVKDILKDRAIVLGDFSLVLFKNGENGKKQPISASATDLYEADRFFMFDYYEYGEFNTENADSSVIISKSYADKSGLGVGDSFKVELLNEEIEYTVEAVAENSGILLKKDVLLPIESVIRLLSERSAFISSLGDSFEPYNRIMIKCGDGENVSEIAELVSNDPAMTGCRVDNMAENSDGESFAEFESVSTLLLAFLISGLSILLIITSQSLMQKQRSLEYALFCAAGASRGHLSALQYTESLIYAALGAVGGILLSPYTLKYVIGLFSWQKYGVAVGFEGIVFGTILAFGLCFIGTFITVRRYKRRELALMLSEENYPKASTEGSKAVIVVGVLLCVAVLASVICPIQYRYIPMIPAIILFMILLYVSSGHIIKAIASITEKIALRKKKIGGVGLLTYKSLKNNNVLRQSGRMLSVLFSLLCAIFICSSELSRQYDAFDNIINGEIITVNMNAETAEQIRNDPSVKGVSTFYYGDSVLINDKYEMMTIFTTGDSEICLSEKFAPEIFPDKGEIVISEPAAKLAGTKTGEFLTIEINGQTYSVKVVEVSKTKIPMIVLDCSYIPVNLNLNCIKLNDGVSVDDEAYGEIVADIMSCGGQIVDEKDITGAVMSTMGGFLSLVSDVVVVAVIISLVGCSNIFLSVVLSRKRDRAILRLCGMEKHRVIAMHIFEAIITVIVTLIIGMICGAVICVGLNVCLNSFGFALF